MGRPDKTKHITKWLRVQDQRKPRRVAPMCLLSSLRGKSKSSKKPSVSWTPIRTVSCPPATLLLLSAPSANPSPILRPLVQSTSHKWSCFSQKKWPEALMMTIPSLRPSRLSKSTQKCSDTPSSLSVTNSQTKKLIMPTVNSLLKMDSLMPPTRKASWSPRRRKEKNKLLLFFNFKILLPFFIFRQNTIETNLKKNNVSQASFDSKTTLTTM